MEELDKALQQSHDSAAGPNEIHYQILRHLPESTKITMLDTFNNYWNKGNFPATWQQAMVLPFPKPGKAPTDPSSYRPI